MMFSPFRYGALIVFACGVLAACSSKGPESGGNASAGASAVQSGMGGVGGAGATGGLNLGVMPGSGGASDSCDSRNDKNGCPCDTSGENRACLPDAAGPNLSGACTSGVQVCTSSGSKEFVSHAWGECTGYTVPAGGCGMASGGGSGGGAAGNGNGAWGGNTGTFPPPPPLCVDHGTGIPLGDDIMKYLQERALNPEPMMLIGYSPASGQSVGLGGQIKVWVGDESAPLMAPDEAFDPTTGKITTPGNRTAKDERGYLYEPAIYIAPETPENGGTPHFPTAVRGSVSTTSSGSAAIPTMDPFPSGAVDRSECDSISDSEGGCRAEYIWDVSSLGLSAGNYLAEFVVHDGDEDRGVGCIPIVITH